MSRLPLVLSLLVGACGSKGDSGADDTDAGIVTTDGTRGGACGAVTEHDLEVVGRVVDDAGAAAVGAEVRLEERAWSVPSPGLFGSTTTDATGAFAFDAPGVVSVEDCWGTALDYVLIAELGSSSGELDANSALFAAINTGDLEADLTVTPVVIR